MNKAQLINDSIDYILKHFDEEITIEDVADNFHFSKYYFCRIFKEVTGESLYAFIKRLKMDQSAIDIKLLKSKKITEIGVNYGYSSSNYSSAFSKHHQVSPYEFRRAANAANMISPFKPDEMIKFRTFDEYDAKITVQEIGDFLVIYERMIGNYIELREKWITFMNAYSNSICGETIMIERYYNDPTITDLNRCVCDLCMTVDKTCKYENITTINGGRFLIYPYEGSIQDIFSTLQGLFRIWMPHSIYRMDKRYGLNIYRKIDKDQESVIMDICIPIK